MKYAINFAKKLLSNKLIKEVSWSFLTKGSTFIWFYALQIFLIRYMSIEEWGKWSYFFSILNVVVLTSELGINVSSKKFLAQYNNSIYQKAVIKSTLKLRLIATSIVALILLIFHQKLATYIVEPELKKHILLAILFASFYSFQEYFKAVFEGFHRLKYNFIINTSEHLSRLLLIFLLFTTFHNFTSILFSYAFSSFFSTCVGFALMYFLFYKKLKNQKTKPLDKDILRYSIPIFVMAVGGYLSLEVDTIMLSNMKGDYETGIYSTAKKIIQNLPHISLAMSVGLMPIFAKLNQNNISELRKKFYNLLKINIIVYILLITVLVNFAFFFIPFIFGEEYTVSILPLQLLTPYLFLISISHYTGLFLTYRGLVKKCAINLTITVVANIALNFWLIPIYGAKGAAIATSVSYFPYFLLNFLAAKKELSIVKK